MACIQLGTATIDLEALQVVIPDGARSLTRLEVALLAFLLANRGETVSRERLLTEVWGYSPDAVTRAVDNTISRLRRKIEPDPASPRWLVSTRGGGYRLEANHAEPVGNLPAPVPFVGRARELAAIGGALGVGRLVSLVGPAAAGKTRLALQAARQHSARFPGQTWLAELSRASNPEEMLHAIALALGVPLLQRDPGAQLVAALGGRGPVLLVLDRYDPVLDAAATFLSTALDHAPELVVLATGRAPLRLRGERRLPVEPLLDPERRALVDAQVRAAEERHGSYFALVAAARRAIGRGDLDQAVTACVEAWAVVSRIGPVRLGATLAEEILEVQGLCAAHRAILGTIAGLAHHRAGDGCRALAHAERAVAAARGACDPRAEARALDVLGRILRRGGDLAGAEAAHRASLALAPDPVGLWGLGQTLEAREDTARALQTYEDVRSEARQLGDHRLQAQVAARLATLQAQAGRWAEAEAAWEEAAEAARALGDLGGEAVARSGLGALARDRDDPASAFSLLEAALPTLCALGDRRSVAAVHRALGELQLDQDRAESAVRSLASALALLRETDGLQIAGWTGWYALALARCGRRAEAEHAFAEASAGLPGVGGLAERAELLAVRARAELWWGAPERASAQLAEARALAAQAGLGDNSPLARHIARCGRGLPPATHL